ncbi:helix-turn-helix transcriptional regulator [Hymenobacter sp. 15J16-1T3B]|uniref:helix-turn-helix domain-containing protein n=1 Tax=Hymenobacter sp. 15J16-1T3B TaxID=2886941 RepID=UPI001D1119D3|nr:helix-turn-helix transcriptional regulator [Hymenobacter sp. 15J16-1T3B]MCC3159312.1 helix-turn-helix transcriptional regulator [Hymenobacter sp. 15J16-1T3B]
MLFQFGPYSSLLLPFFVQGIVFSVLLLVRSWRRSEPADRWLAALILLLTANVAQWMLGFAGWYDAHNAYSTFMFYFPFPMYLGAGPLFYFYFRSLTNPAFRLQPRQRWHFAPFFAYLGWFAVCFGVDVLLRHGLLGQPLPEHFGTKGALISLSGVHTAAELLNYVSLAGYGYLALREFRQYARYLDDNFSDTERRRFRWLRHVLVAVLAGTMVSVAFSLVGLGVELSYVQFWYSYLFTGVLLYYLSVGGWQAQQQWRVPLQFEPAPLGGDPATAPAEVPVAPADAAAEAPAAELLRWTERLEQLMRAERPYLEPDLSLAELAARLRTNPVALSKVINSGFGQNFNDFVNGYRVTEAERLLIDPRYQHYTLVAIALESGFNSKSTFNRVFKKLRGETPSEAALRLKSQPEPSQIIT